MATDSVSRLYYFFRVMGHWRVSITGSDVSQLQVGSADLHGAVL